MERPESIAVVPVLISLVLLGALAFFLKFPPIRDVTTTPDDPPRFLAEPPGSIDYPERYAGLQQSAYPDLEPLATNRPAAETLERAKEAAREMEGWEIVAESDSLAAFQAVARTRLFGFSDDVVVQVRPTDDGGSEVHIRSRSRIGRMDFGTNARRIRNYLERLER